ncbi:uncharacterized protein [Triticum aestivum]|uniref:uncharacterized protein n=1 Tax=Triticum aestivum TaxID=4565 RepID=UPI001D010376|nr:uncharacterized protein LOC123158658 [Triticum aestivum]
MERRRTRGGLGGEGPTLQSCLVHGHGASSLFKWIGKTIRFCTKHPVVWIIQPAVRANLGKKKHDQRRRTGSPPLPLAQVLAAAATTHAGSFRRAPTPRSTPPNSPQSAPPYPPARFSAPGLYRPLETPPPWLGFRAGLRRRVSGGPDADGARHGNSPSTMVAAIKGFFTEMWRTPWTCSSKVNREEP